jgi:hypothetical protein
VKYAVLFDSPVDAAKLQKLLGQLKIRFTSVEVLGDSFVNDMEASMEKVLTTVRTDLQQHQAALARARLAFYQNPTPSLGSIIKSLERKVAYRLKKEAGQVPEELS